MLCEVECSFTQVAAQERPCGNFVGKSLILFLVTAPKFSGLVIIIISILH